MMEHYIVKGKTLLQTTIDPELRRLVAGMAGGPNLSEEASPRTRVVNALNGAVGWMRAVQARQVDGGIAGLVELSSGHPRLSGSYPETTGYSIPTLFDYARAFSDGKASEAAVRAADFLLTLQDKEGAFPGGLVGKLTGPSAFNSAQIIDGLLRAYQETTVSTYLDSAVRACEWLCRVQEADGGWGRSNYLGVKRTYDSKVDEALLRVAAEADRREFAEAAHRNLDWVVQKQDPDGWFHDCDNSVERNDAPLTHTIGYTAQGLLESHIMTGRADLLDAAKRALYALLDAFEGGEGLLPARFRSGWEPGASYSCITGDAQASICWSTLSTLTGDQRLLDSAHRMNRLLCSIQISSAKPEWNGSLPSSWPLGGDYFPYKLTNWTNKYYADALLLEHRSLESGRGKASE